MKTPFGKTPGQRSRADAGHAGVSANMMKKRTSHNNISNQRCTLGRHNDWQSSGTYV
uniref:Spindlin 1 n=12 Tax=Simiiformes TaxID=314293 RepID=Q5R5U9_PONAB|nr:uncharacterized protein LOC100189812 [Pongo abelii]CAH92867.1 hypothetical protein [Pongo abelii]